MGAGGERGFGLLVGFLGIATGIFAFLRRSGPLGSEAIASGTGLDPGYVSGFCAAGFAFGYLEEADGRFFLSPERDRSETPGEGSFPAAAIEAVFAPSVALRLLPLFRTGDRPGSSALIDSAILPWFGQFLEEKHRPLFEQEILSGLPLFSELSKREGLVLDLGCGNGWLLRRLLLRLPRWRGIGIDREAARLAQGREAIREAGLSERMELAEADLLSWSGREPAALIVASRVLHHLWPERERLFAHLDRLTTRDGTLFLWEPCWPGDLASLRDPARQNLAFQNLHEYAQGARLLRADELIEAVEEAGWKTEACPFAGGSELVVLGRRRGTGWEAGEKSWRKFMPNMC